LSPADPAGDEPSLTLQEVAERLGVHYMTAYRHVRTGQLRARRHGGRWYVSEADLAAFPGRGPPGRRPASMPAMAGERHRTRLLDRLLAGDERGAWQVVETALVAGTTPERAHLDLLAPCMAEVGDRWASGRVTVGDEHVASATAARIAARLAPLSVGPGRRTATVVLAGVPDEQHGLPLTLLANVLRARGWRVVELGANTPVDDIVDAARQADQLVAVGVSVGSAATLPSAAATLAVVRGALPDVALLAGGPAIPDAAAARALGADAGGGDADATAALLTDLRTPRPH
jgi:MerR family transcriptional regulator, light-induced transcriptional regulator